MLCDELKVYVPQDGPWGLETEEGGKLVEEETCYLKSEADKVIAELKAENERLRGESCKLTDGCLRLKQCRKEKAHLADELRHSKYKRCLAMAAVCFEKSYSTTLVKYDKESGLFRNFYDWWGKRWLALAEKFKEAK